MFEHANPNDAAQEVHKNRFDFFRTLALILLEYANLAASVHLPVRIVLIIQKLYLFKGRQKQVLNWGFHPLMKNQTHRRAGAPCDDET